MEIKLSQQTVKTFFPEAYNELEKKKSKSKAAAAGRPLADFKLSYDFCVHLDDGGMTGTEFVNYLQSPDIQAHEQKKRKERETREDSMTLDQWIENAISNWQGCIKASCNRCHLYHKVTLDPKNLPTEVIEHLNRGWKQFQDDIAERKRFDAMSPEEQQADIDRLLEELRTYSGFVEVKF